MSVNVLSTTILVTLALSAILELTQARVLYSFHKQTNKSNNSVSYNDVTKWQNANARTPPPARHQQRAMQADTQAVDYEQLSELQLLRETHKQVMQLRSNMANLKYQNHMIYKQMKRYNNRCMAGTAPMLPETVAALRTCPRDYTWNDKAGKCYKFANDRSTWRIAREKCRNSGGDLVSIENQREQRFIVDMARNSKDLRHCDFWTGATNQNSNSQWQWVATKNALSYTHWNHNEPNNGNGDEHCMHMLWVFGWMWNDSRCNYGNSCYICEVQL